MEETIEIINPFGFIYCTTNLINGMKYIGQKIFNKGKGWQNYLGSGIYFKKALKKYGRENFSREIIAIAYSKEELNELEIEFIKEHNAVKSEDYYNLVDGGGTTTGLHMSEEARKKISERTKGENHPLYGIHRSEETKKKISEANSGKNNSKYGKHLSNETKQKLRETNSGEKSFMYGKHLSDETKYKIGEAERGEKNHNYGKTFSDEYRKKISDAQKGEKNHMFGKHHSEETKKKLSESQKGENGYWFGTHHSEETKKKQSEALKGEKSPMFGKHKSDEQKKKQSEAEIKFNAEQIAEIREKYATGEYTQQRLAEGYFVNHATINNVVHYKNAYKNR